MPEENINKYIPAHVDDFMSDLKIGYYKNDVANSRIVDANQAMARLLEYDSAKELLYIPSSSLYDNPRDREIAYEELKRYGILKKKRIAMKTKSGNAIWCWLIARQKYDESGELKWTECLIEKKADNSFAESTRKGSQDVCRQQPSQRVFELASVKEMLATEIVERRWIEQELRENKKRFRQLATSTDVAFFLISRSSESMLYVSPGFEKIFGISAQACYENTKIWLDCIQKEDRKHILYDIRENSEEVAEKYCRITSYDGILRWVKFKRTLIKDSEGEYYRIACVVEDVTENRRTIQFLSSIFESMGECLVVVDQEYKIVTANRAYCELVESSREKIIGKKCHEVYLKTKIPCGNCGKVCAVMHTFKTGDYGTTVHAYSKDNTDTAYLDVRTYPIKDASGNIMYAIEILDDISEKIKLEHQLYHSQKMESIGILAGGIAHDFNNILTAIIGFSTILQMKMKDESLKKNVEQILVASNRAAQLTKSLLAFSRKQIINPKPVDLNSIIEKLSSFISRAIGEDIELKTELLQSENVIVLADSGQIEQVLLNLVTNARDAMPNGGQLLIEIRKEIIDVEFIREKEFGKIGKYGLITVSDTGTGIEEDILKKIFDPFFTTKEIGKGTGLGLSIVYGIVKQHNGFIGVSSTINKGTTFSIFLPLIDAEIEKDKPVQLPILLGGSETILLAEDEPAVMNYAQYILEEYGYKVIKAADGEEAVNKFKEGNKTIQMLILDVTMPKKNGKEVYEIIKKMNPAIKVIFMSGYTGNILNESGAAIKDFVFISKPFEPQELLKKIRENLDK